MVFSLVFPVLACCDHKIVQTSKQKQFSDHAAQIIESPGKLSEINKQFHVK
jgi:hypothetical protein